VKPSDQGGEKQLMKNWQTPNFSQLPNPRAVQFQPRIH
jgi:hypothetical protein